ncbi:MAG TPA: hypothetical protein VNY82_04270 [Steroidobacteraceae bacterium]|nr:hypothetical protein [Steroidobacteraceae bacterium]
MLRRAVILGLVLISSLIGTPADYAVHDVSMQVATGVTTTGSTVTAAKQP